VVPSSSVDDEIELPMSRRDIADYLGLTIETVSRTMMQLEKETVIDVPSARRIVLRDRVALTRVAVHDNYTAYAGLNWFPDLRWFMVFALMALETQFNKTTRGVPVSLPNSAGKIVILCGSFGRDREFRDGTELREAVANTANLKVTRCARGASGLQENAGYAALRAERAKAVDRFAVSLKPVIAEIRANGANTPTAIAKELNNLGLLTPKGNQWDGHSVRRLLGRQAAFIATG
jgi:hypothetical protein